jgi:hypothetical protein
MNGDTKCSTDEPLLREVRPSHWASCHHIDRFAEAPATKPMLTHKREVTQLTAEEVA